MNARDGTEGPALHAGRRMTSLLADALVGARFLSVWIATGVLLLVAKIIAPEALQSTSWSFVLPYMTILAIAALGQMLVIMHAGIDLSTPGVMFLGGYLIVGVGHHDNSRLWIAILACLGLGVLVGLINGILVGILRLNPLIVTLAVGQIVLAEGLRYANGLAEAEVPSRLASFAQNRPLDISAVFWTGAAITVAVALLLRYTAPGRRFQAVGANPQAAWMAGVHVRAYVVFAYAAAGTLYALAAVLARSDPRQRRSRRSGRPTCSRRSPPSSSPARRSRAGLASATSTWVAAFALTLLNQMLIILGIAVGWQFIVFGAAIIVGMLISGDRVASLLGRLLRPRAAPTRIASGVEHNTG